ncbi:hypothetical protein [Megasphaera vaginalis (ex Bordigoni et al. 2020)]|uniref:hypothetical protein n=1 Tax=Megasphaera vaginalis (ex Bordigoni et al. 2020) TaxID=2045301 RepID=UPI000C7D21A7|nr:hypothetical protein [Megasphaera vaginalis (ex Bordigoni et al. 2020)]
MKKLRAFILLIGFFVLGSVLPLQAAYDYHLNGDHNFVFVDGHMGTAWYLDKSSLIVEQYAPPQYIIAVNVCTVQAADRGNKTISKVMTKRFFYNWDLRQMYVDRDGTSNWRYLKPMGSWAETGFSMPAGEMAFYLAYGRRFYGGKLWYNSFLQRNERVYQDSFYQRI